MTTGLSGRSFERALTLLEHLSADGAPVPLSTLARRADLPKSTAHRLLGTLAAHGLVTKEMAGYLVGKRFSVFGARPDLRPLRGFVVPRLVDLQMQIGGVVSFGTIWRDSVIYLDRVQGHTHMNISSRLLARHAPTDDPIGRLLLLRRPPHEPGQITMPVHGREAPPVAAVHVVNSHRGASSEDVAEAIRGTALSISVTLRRMGVESTRHLVDSYAIR